MKIFALAVCLLLIAATTYGANEALNKFQEEYSKCAGEVARSSSGSVDSSVAVLRCMASKEDPSFRDTQGMIKLDKAVDKAKMLITDKDKFEEAKKILTKCHEEASKTQGSIEEKNTKYIKCGLPVYQMLDKN